MAERYTRLYSLTENLYQSGAPILIAAGALLKDTQTGRVLAQIKLQSLSDKPIKAAKIDITPLDVVGNELGEAVEHKYLDLTVKRDEAFGAKSPIALPDATTRAFRAAVISVVFADNSIWEALDTTWEPIPSPVSLAEAYPNTELCKQFKLEFGAKSQYAYAEFADLCRCPCGALNRQEEAECHTCGCDLTALRTLDIGELEKRKNERLEQERIAEDERQERERIAKEKAAAETAERTKKIRKIAKIAVPIAVVVIVFLVVLNSVILPNSMYNKAVTLMEAGQYEEAIDAFEAMDGYRDSVEKIEACEAAVELADLNAKYDNALARMEAGNYKGAIEAFVALDGYKDSEDKIEECETAILDGQYDAALALMESEEYEKAITAFEDLDGHKDSRKKIKECETAILDGKYEAAEALQQKGENAAAAMAFGRIGDYKDARERSFALWETVTDRSTIAVGYTSTVALKTDGTVELTGGVSAATQKEDTDSWTDIVAVAAGGSHTVGLKSNGKVVATGNNDDGQCDVGKWTDIVAITASTFHTVGLKSDGTVVAVGRNTEGQCNVQSWKDIVAISANFKQVVGLKSDGTVVAVGDNGYGQCNVSDWTDVVAIEAGTCHTVGLKSDGTVVAVGSNYRGPCNVSDWTDVARISAGSTWTVGVKPNGVVVVAGAGNVDNYGYEQFSAPGWSNVADVAIEDNHMVALKKDGSLVSVHCSYMDDDERWDVYGGTDVKLPE